MKQRPAEAVRVAGRRAGRRFDAENGVTTEALIFLGDLDPEAIGSSLAHATHYEPTPIGETAALLERVPFDVAQATFVDLGSGMGRALMEAMRFPFRQIVGVEISPALHAVARENFERYGTERSACRDVRLVRADAAAYRLPRGDLVVYLYNPFSGEILSRVLERLSEGHARHVAVAYHTPVERALFEAHPAFELVSEIPFGAVFILRRTAHTATLAARDPGSCD